MSFRATVPFGIGCGDAHTVLEQVVNLAVGSHQAHARAVAGQFLDGLVDGLDGRFRVKLEQGQAPANLEDDFRFGLASQRTDAVVELVIGVDRLPAQLTQQGDNRLLDQSFFGVTASGIAALQCSILTSTPPYLFHPFVSHYPKANPQVYPPIPPSPDSSRYISSPLQSVARCG